MKNMTVGLYLIERLDRAGLKHMFGVPGEYVLDFMDRVVSSDIELIRLCFLIHIGQKYRIFIIAARDLRQPMGCCHCKAEINPPIWHNLLKKA